MDTTTGYRSVRSRETPGPIIGHNLALVLAEKGWSQYKAARQLDVNDVAIGRWIKGKVVPGWGALLRFEEVLGKPPSWFYEDRLDTTVEEWVNELAS